MFKWLSRLFEKKSNVCVIQRHIDGSPSLIVDKGYIRLTEDSILGSVVLFQIETNFGKNIKYVKDVLLGKYDHCLIQTSKDKVIRATMKVLIDRSYTAFTKEEGEDHLTFKKKYITKEQAVELKACLAQSGEHRLYTAEVVGSKPTASTR